MWKIHWSNIYGSVQFKVVSVLCVEKPISCTLSLTHSPHTFETVPVFSWSVMALSCAFKEDHIFLYQQVFSGPRSLALCPQVVSQVPQHFTSTKMQVTCDVFLSPSQSARSFSLLWHVPNSTPTEVFGGGCQRLAHATLGFPERADRTVRVEIHELIQVKIQDLSRAVGIMCLAW